MVAAEIAQEVFAGGIVGVEAFAEEAGCACANVGVVGGGEGEERGGLDRIFLRGWVGDAAGFGGRGVDGGEVFYRA